MRGLVPELPFSNIWAAQHAIGKLPANSALHLGILNSFRSWNFFELPHKNILAYCNTGGFGIDGCLSSMLGASLASPDRIFFGVIGDLAFYYDINALGNKHVSRNLRLIVVNNELGQEFRNSRSLSGSALGEGADPFIAARGHFAGQSRGFLKSYAEDLGFEYLAASNKEEYLANIERFTVPEMTEKPMFFELFIDTKDETKALDLVMNIDVSAITPLKMRAKSAAKRTVKALIGSRNIRRIKKLLGR